MDFTNANTFGQESLGYPSSTILTDRSNATLSLQTMRASPTRRYDSLKRLLDFSAAVALIVTLCPIMAVAWLLVRLTSSGPGIYTQTRVGLGGRHFRIYKLRSMTHNCEATTGGAKWSKPGDSRVTPVGRIFRKLHIDELPQLFNVLSGDMSLIGPRPERPEFVKPLSVSVPEYKLRLAVRPGVTGLAQIQLPPDTDLDSVRRKIVLDRAYIEGRGLWLDLRLLVGTGIYLVGFPYTSVRRVLSLPNPLMFGPQLLMIKNGSSTVPVDSATALDKMQFEFTTPTLNT